MLTKHISGAQPEVSRYGPRMAAVMNRSSMMPMIVAAFISTVMVPGMPVHLIEMLMMEMVIRWVMVHRGMRSGKRHHVQQQHTCQ
jgi:hypothetical protein